MSNTYPSPDFGRAIRMFRAGADLSQQEFADIFGITRGWLSAIERGRANPSRRLGDLIWPFISAERPLPTNTPPRVEWIVWSGRRRVFPFASEAEARAHAEEQARRAPGTRFFIARTSEFASVDNGTVAWTIAK